jgi:hypothetical protein
VVAKTAVTNIVVVMDLSMSVLVRRGKSFESVEVVN